MSSFSVTGFTGFPEGITYSPVTTNLYVVNGSASEVLGFTISGNHVATYAMNGFSLDGIAHDPRSNTFWVYDSGTDSILHYDENFIELSAAPGTAANGLGSGEGLALVGSNIYIVAPAAGQVGVFETGVVGITEIFGSGCPQLIDFYERFPAAGSFDLSGTSFTIDPVGNGFTVTATGSFDPSCTNNRNSSDDQLFTALPLGFSATFPGLGTISTIDVDSNGRIGIGLPFSDVSESVGELLAQRVFAACWDDFNPLAGGALYFDTAPGVAMITWDQVPQFGFNDSNTFQIKLHDDGRIEASYVQVSDDALVGLSDGSSAADPDDLDISASLPFSRSGGGLPLTLTAMTRPVLGQGFDLSTANIPPTAIGGGVIFGSSPINLTAPGLLPNGCSILSSGDVTTLPLDLVTGASSIQLANDQSIFGLTLCAQTAVIDLTLGDPIPVTLSNGLEFTIGDI